MGGGGGGGVASRIESCLLYQPYLVNVGRLSDSKRRLIYVIFLATPLKVVNKFAGSGGCGANVLSCSSCLVAE